MKKALLRVNQHASDTLDGVVRSVYVTNNVPYARIYVPQLGNELAFVRRLSNVTIGQRVTLFRRGGLWFV